MSKQLNDKCAICGSYLFSDDDIVHCPDCGAPHHRDCWEAVGHCGMEEYHGTENEYRPEKNTETSEHTVCPNCHKEQNENSRFCPYCGYDKQQNTPKSENANGDFRVFAPLGNGAPVRLDPYGGINKEDKIDGVKVGELAKFIGYSPNNMLPMFKAIDTGKKKHFWSWMAFISPYSHALYRKMNLACVMYLLFEFISYILMTPLYSISAAIIEKMPIGTTATQLFNEMMSNPEKYMAYSNTFSTLAFILGIIIFIGIRIFAGLNNVNLYKNTCIKKYKEIENDTSLDDEERECKLASKGGARPFLSLLLFMVSTYFPSVIPLLVSGLLF